MTEYLQSKGVIFETKVNLLPISKLEEKIEVKELFYQQNLKNKI